MSSLSDWSEAIKRQGEESDKKEAERLRIVKVQGKKINPETMENKVLLDMYDHCRSSMGDHNPKIGKEFEKVTDKLRAEIMKRMNSKDK